MAIEAGIYGASRGRGPMTVRVLSVRSVALRRGFLFAWLAIAGLAATATAKADDAWQAKLASKRAGSSSLIDADLAAIGERLRRRASTAPSGKRVAFIGAQSLTLAAPPALSPRKMRAERERPSEWDMVWRDGEDTPAFITGGSFAARPVPPVPTRTGRTPAKIALELLEAHRDVFALAHPRDEVRHAETVRSDDGRLHVRFERQVKGIAVWGEDLVVHMEASGVFYAFNGRYSPTPVAPTLAAQLSAETAVEQALDYLLGYTTVRPLGEYARQLLDYNGPTAQLFLKRGDDGALRPAWCVEVRPNLWDRWLCFVDAVSGEVVDAYNATPTDGPATAAAIDLKGGTQTLNVFDVEGVFVLVDGSRPMFVDTQTNLIGNPQGAIVTLSAEEQDLTRSTRLAHVQSEDNTWADPVAVSAHANMGAVFEYYLQTFGRLSIDGLGGSMLSVIHVTDQGQPMDNAFWNGVFMAYGDGNVAFDPLAEALDVAAHEMTHGVIQNTVNLEYRGQSGALNESFADVFAVMVDRDDWQLGEDVIKSLRLFPSGALRDMADPHNGVSSASNAWQPAHMSEFRDLPLAVDNGGVHVNSGIPNRACFLVADAIGRDKTERIYYRILDARLISPRGDFVDMRRAARQSAIDLFGDGSPEVEAVLNAFTTVGVVGDEGYEPPQRRAPTPGERWLLVVNAEGSDRGLYLVRPEVESEGDIVELTSTPVNGDTGNSVTVAADGSFVLFVDADNNLRGIDIDGSNEEVLSATGDWASIALSPDQRRLAATTIFRDHRIFLFDLVDPERSKALVLRRPTTQEGVATDVVQFADAMDWDPDSQFLIYDALNTILTATGDSLSFWEVNMLDPDEGFVVPLLPPQPEGLQLGNPSFARTTGRQVAFDRLDSRIGSNEIWVFDLVTGDAGFIVDTGAALGFPSFAVDDSELAYNRQDGSGRRIVARIPLDDSRLASAGPGDNFLFDAQIPNWLVIAEPEIPTSVDAVGGDGEPTAVELIGNYPNPFNPATTIRFKLPSTGRVELAVFDVRGALVAKLVTGERDAGEHAVVWDGMDDLGRPAASGVYLYRLRAPSADGVVREASGRMVLMR